MDKFASNTQLTAFIVLAVVSADIVRRIIRNCIWRKGCPLPPGPTPLPFLGSALSVNSQEPFRTYTEWQKRYGDIVYIRLLDMDVVVLNSTSVATDLLEKRAQIYSDRPFIATVKPYGHQTTFAFASYGEYLKLCRKIFHQTFRTDAVANFHPMQICKSRQLLLNLMDDPDNYATHFTTFLTSVTMRSIYSYDPRPKDDPIVKTINDFIEISAPALLPEKAVLLKVFPFLLYLPDWLPGSWIKREARRSRELGEKMVNEPFEYTQKCMDSKDYTTSMVSNHITLMETFDDSYRLKYKSILKDTSSTAFMASVETTMSTLMTFTLAMVRHPHIWKRAQADIDTVVGTERLPSFSDRSSLPYVDAIVRESLRWLPPLPLGIPHATTTSDVCNGFYIPKGATVFGNIWAMSRDKIRYPDPESFIPERFLDEDDNLTDDVPDFVFGFGRRACPGRYSADATLWIAMATMLAAFNFNCAKDADGKELEFEVEYMNGMARHPLTFPCCITPRSHIDRASLEREVK